MTEEMEKTGSSSSARRRRFAGQAYIRNRNSDTASKIAHTASSQGTPAVGQLSSPDLGDYERFKRKVRRLVGIDLNLYKEGQMKRRIGTFISRRKSESYEEYAERLVRDPNELELFVDYLTINVTDFFRDDAFWGHFDDKIAPKLIASFSSEAREGNEGQFLDPTGSHDDGLFTVWCSACSTGEEAYSLAMSLSRRIPLTSIHIIASDIDERALGIAREGWYSAEAVETVPKDFLDQFFEKDDGGYRVKDVLRACVDFRHLDLLKDEYPKGCHLVTCRNVLIYFTAQAKEEVFSKYAESLVPGGILFMGRTEQIVNWKNSAYMRLAPSFYERRMI